MPVEILGGDDRPPPPPRPPRRAVRGAWVALALLVAVVGLVSLRPSPATVPDEPTQTAGGVLLSGPELRWYDVTTGRAVALSIPPGQVREGVALRDGAVVLVDQAGGADNGGGPGYAAYAVAPGAGAQRVGPARAVVGDLAGTGSWLTLPGAGAGAGAGAAGPRVRHVDRTGTPLQADLALPAGTRLVAEVDRGLLVAPEGRTAGPVVVLDKGSGSVVRQITSEGVVQAVAAAVVAWTPRPGYGAPVVLTRVDDGSSRGLPSLPHGYGRLGPVALSRDGGRVALLAVPADDMGRPPNAAQLLVGPVNGPLRIVARELPRLPVMGGLRLVWTREDAVVMPAGEARLLVLPDHAGARQQVAPAARRLLDAR